MRGIPFLMLAALALAGCQPSAGIRGALHQTAPDHPGTNQPATPGVDQLPGGTAGTPGTTGTGTLGFGDGGMVAGAPGGAWDAGYLPSTSPIGGLGTPGFTPLWLDGGTSTGVGGAGTSGMGFSPDSGTP